MPYEAPRPPGGGLPPTYGGGGPPGSARGMSSLRANPFYGRLGALPARRPVPDIPPPNYQNPYRDIEGFENYQHPLLRWGRGDTFPGGRVDLSGFPSHDRVQQISDAQRALRGQSLLAPRVMGRGLSAQNPDILELLRERLGMGAI